MDAQQLVLQMVRTERALQELKFGPEGTCACPSMDDGLRLAVLTEEVGEVARELCEYASGNRSSAEFRKNLVAELTQVAAVAVAWIEGLST